MKIAFATAQSMRGSTNVGRILPLAAELTKLGHECHMLVLSSAPPRQSGGQASDSPRTHYVGSEPFRRTAEGKVRLRGARLVLNMLATALRTVWALLKLKPDVVVISKPLPASTLSVLLYNTFGRFYKLQATRYKIVLDADDFELTANKLSSIAQRAVIHWSERTAAGMVNAVVVASPFLADHFKQLTQNTKPIEIVPTGIHAVSGGAVQTKQDPRTRIAYLGSVSISSGHRVDLLPEIITKLIATNPATQLLIAGDGDDVDYLKQEFHKRGISQHVTWHGRFNLSEVKELLAETAIILDPADDSIANRAKSSFRVMLASSLGLPVVTSNIGIRPELLPASFHDRFFAEPGQPASYAEKIEELMQRPLSLTECQQLRQHATQFTWGRLAGRYHEILTV